jgi:hypothetical protein
MITNIDHDGASRTIISSKEKSEKKSEKKSERNSHFCATDLLSVPAPQKYALKQLVIFVNLPAISCKKVQTFMAYAQNRVDRLSCVYSAIMICPGVEGKEFDVLDAGEGFTPELCIGTPLPENKKRPELTKRTTELTQKNLKFADEFLKLSAKTEGTYDHILIIGVGPSSDSSMSSYSSVSGIENIDSLSDTLLHLTDKYSSSNTKIRVQVCLAGRIIMKKTGKTFAESIVPDKCIAKLSMPKAWSVISNRGAAIDFYCSDNLFEKVAPFFNLALTNVWMLDDIKSKFNSAEVDLAENKISKKQISIFQNIIFAKSFGVTWDNLQINYSNKLKTDMIKKA